MKSGNHVCCLTYRHLGLLLTRSLTQLIRYETFRLPNAWIRRQYPYRQMQSNGAVFGSTVISALFRLSVVVLLCLVVARTESYRYHTEDASHVT